MSAPGRPSAGAKLLALLVLTSLVVALRSPLAVGGAALAVVIGYAVAGLGPRRLLTVLRPLRWMVPIIALVQGVTAGWTTALLVAGSIVVAVAAAGLVTATTTTSELLDTLTRALRPLRRLGVDPERVAMAFSLAVRALPVIQHAFEEAQDARRARGQERSVRALVTPVVVRTIRHAERTGEALAARGFDD